MVMGKRVVGMSTDDYKVTPDRGWVILHPEVLIGHRVADLLVGGGRRRADHVRPKRRYRQQQHKPKPRRAITTQSHKPARQTCADIKDLSRKVKVRKSARHQIDAARLKKRPLRWSEGPKQPLERRRARRQNGRASLLLRVARAAGVGGRAALGLRRGLLLGRVLLGVMLGVMGGLLGRLRRAFRGRSRRSSRSSRRGSRGWRTGVRRMHHRRRKRAREQCRRQNSQSPFHIRSFLLLPLTWRLTRAAAFSLTLSAIGVPSQNLFKVAAFARSDAFSRRSWATRHPFCVQRR